MQSETHKQHIAANVSHANCPECRADNSRWHAQSREHEYKYVHEYLTWVRPRLDAIRNGAIERERAQGEYNALWVAPRFRPCATQLQVSSQSVGREYPFGPSDRRAGGCTREGNMTAIDAARTVVQEGCCLLRQRQDDPLQYDVKPMFTGKRRGWFYLDSFSASAIVAVYDALNETNRAKFERMRIDKMAGLAFRFVK